MGIAAIVIFCYFFGLFLLGTIRHNNSIVDIGWGIGFVIVAWIMLPLRLPTNLTQVTITLLITLWGVRLFTHIYRRNHRKPEDFRYAAFRKAWGRWVVPRAFLQVYMLQGVLMYLIALPVILHTPGQFYTNGWVYGAGMLVFAVGFLFESVGDAQLAAFLRDPAHKGKIMDSGLWRYTRHPNYFGEATMWWGMAVIAVSGGIAPWVFVSPITITLLLLFVSGVPMLEKNMKDRPGYAEYARRTSVFFPWFPKKRKIEQNADA
ncbi:MAG: DUF1295 domain-containing protein [Eubacteriales bacterium]|nr:DUF1295 domain-containing protein [Eubacteriales bacterium]